MYEMEGKRGGGEGGRQGKPGEVSNRRRRQAAGECRQGREICRQVTYCTAKSRATWFKNKR